MKVFLILTMMTAIYLQVILIWMFVDMRKESNRLISLAILLGIISLALVTIASITQFIAASTQ